MDVIEFRAYDVVKKQMHYDITGMTLTKTGHWTVFVKTGESPLPGGRVKLSQYVGLKDIKDKKVFDGDFMRFGDGAIGLIAYCHGNMCGFDAHTKKGTRSVGYTHYGNVGEVIGNMYENPEMMKEVR